MQEKKVVTGIDCHAHIMAVDLPLAPEIHSRPIRDVSAAEYLSVLGAHGISHGVLTAPSFYGSNNALLLEALHLHPNTLRGTVIADSNMAKADLERQLLGMREHGVEGIRLNWIKKKSCLLYTSDAADD